MFLPLLLFRGGVSGGGRCLGPVCLLEGARGGPGIDLCASGGHHGTGPLLASGSHSLYLQVRFHGDRGFVVAAKARG